MDEIAKIETGNTGIPGSNMNDLIKLALTSKDVTPDKLHSLLDFQERVLGKQAEIAFNEAMARLQPKLPEIKKASQGHNSKYAKFEHIERTIRPLYTAEGFSVRYDSELMAQGERYTGTLMHKDGHSVTASMILPADTAGSKSAIQAKGSTVTYARRYLLCMLLNIVTVDEDDDGGDKSATISAKEAQEIKGLLERTGTDDERFLQHYRIVDIESLPKNQYTKARGILQDKLAPKNQKGANNA